MAFTSPRMSLRVWNSSTDPYDHEQLAYNFLKLDQHDHAEGHGTPIPGAGIQDGAITTSKLYPGAITGSVLADGSVTHEKIAPDAIDNAQLRANSVGDSKLVDGAKIPVGTVIQWYRPNTATPIPLGWVECIGQSTTDHSFVGGGTITVPDMRNRFVLGADSEATVGTTGGTGTAPGVGGLGGSHTTDLTHHHSVTVADHIHRVNPHFHNFSFTFDITPVVGSTDDLPNYALKLGTHASGTPSPYVYNSFTTTGRSYTSGSTVPPSGSVLNQEPDTNAAGGFTVNTGDTLGVTDIRAKYVGLIYLMKIKTA